MGEKVKVAERERRLAEAIEEVGLPEIAGEDIPTEGDSEDPIVTEEQRQIRLATLARRLSAITQQKKKLESLEKTVKAQLLETWGIQALDVDSASAVVPGYKISYSRRTRQKYNVETLYGYLMNKGLGEHFLKVVGVLKGQVDALVKGKVFPHEIEDLLEVDGVTEVITVKKEE